MPEIIINSRGIAPGNKSKKLIKKPKTFSETPRNISIF